MYDVNMRLFSSSAGYRNVVLEACRHIAWCATTKKSGYKTPSGYSGSNAGIPWNIIATSSGVVMINPKITKAYGSVEKRSNCGSLTLESNIIVERFSEVNVSYFDIDGNKQEISGELFTVQHEIEHNLGILITDRKAHK